MDNTTGNALFPVFLKLEKLSLLLIGGGNVALEKLTALLNNSPDAHIKLIAAGIKPEVRELLNQNNIPFEQRQFTEKDLNEVDLSIIAINNKTISAEIHSICRSKGVLTNVADTPDLCDFYLGSIVQKGDLKIAISTNGKSPTIAKRVKEVLNDTIPDEIDDLLNNMQRIRNSLSGDFSDKVRQLNSITSTLSPTRKTLRKRNLLKSVLMTIIAAVLLFIAVYFLFSALL